jgi:hypothetical protein
MRERHLTVVMPRCLDARASLLIAYRDGPADTVSEVTEPTETFSIPPPTNMFPVLT